MRLILFTLVIVFFPILAFAQEEKVGDIFSPLLPKKEITVKVDPVVADPELSLLNVEGVLWGIDSHQAIINGKTYTVGDTIREVDARIFKIDKSIVFIEHKNRTYELKIKKAISKKVKKTRNRRR